MKNQMRENFNINLKHLLKQNNLSQVDLAEKINSPVSTVSSWYLGQKFPRPDKVQMLVDFFDVNMEYLLSNYQSSEEKAIYSITEATEIVIKETWGESGYNNLTKEQKEELAKTLKYALLAKKMEMEER